MTSEQPIKIASWVLHQIREHVAAARAEWELWHRDLEEQRLTDAMRHHKDYGPPPEVTGR